MIQLTKNLRLEQITLSFMKGLLLSAARGRYLLYKGGQIVIKILWSIQSIHTSSQMAPHRRPNADICLGRHQEFLWRGDKETGKWISEWGLLARKIHPASGRSRSMALTDNLDQSPMTWCDLWHKSWHYDGRISLRKWFPKPETIRRSYKRLIKD